MVKQCDTDLVSHGWFEETVNGRQVISLQKGVFRTNCLDSLDRTNVAQSKLGFVALQL